MGPLDSQLGNMGNMKNKNNDPSLSFLDFLGANLPEYKVTPHSQRVSPKLKKVKTKKSPSFKEAHSPFKWALTWCKGQSTSP
jgi:hypothetical protein